MGFMGMMGQLLFCFKSNDLRRIQNCQFCHVSDELFQNIGFNLFLDLFLLDFLC